MNRIARIAGAFVAATYLCACATAPATEARPDSGVSAAHCADPSVAQQKAPEPMPCAQHSSGPSPETVRTVGLILLTVGLIAMTVAITRAATVPFYWQGGIRP